MNGVKASAPCFRAEQLDAIRLEDGRGPLPVPGQVDTNGSSQEFKRDDAGRCRQVP